jgi:sugar phosphate isomerase/epimerase
MLREICNLGFEYAELSHGIRSSLLPEIIKAVGAGEIKISSLHNFCPLPIGINYAAPNIFKFSSSDQRERENAYRHTLKTIELAERLKVPVIILHLGSVEMKDYTTKPVGMAEGGNKGSPKYERLCMKVSERRERKKEKHLQFAYDVLRQLADQAEARGLKLGVENREGLEEIPFDDDLPFLFKEFTSLAVGYWHDTGHAQIKENLGFINHAMQMESLAGRLAGIHVHDVQFPAKDHRPPGEGTVDFAALKPWIKPDQIKVFEMSPGVEVEELQRGVAHLKSLWGSE